MTSIFTCAKLSPHTEVTELKKTVRRVAILGVLAVSLATTACQGANLYTGVDSNGGWSGPVSRPFGGGITGYPF